MKKFQKILCLVIVTFTLTACNNNSSDVKRDLEANPSVDPGHFSEEQVQDKGQNRENNVVQVPQIYQDFLKKKDMEDEETIVFFVSEDIDLDGVEEAIVATGYSGQDSTIAEIYILRNQNGTIEQLSDNLNNGGYGVNEIKLIHLEDRPEKVIYLGLTNFASMTGFEIVALSNKKPTVICYSASATGAGDDELKDFDLDGEYDGYVQNRWSYDVLYYSVSRTFTLEHGDFKLSSTSIEIPDYPSNSKEVVLQYLSLRAISAENSPEVDKRLSELCQYCTEHNEQAVSDIWIEAVYRSIAEFDDKIIFDIYEDKKTAKVGLTLTEGDKNEHKLNFHLVKSDSKWTIEEIQ